MKKKILSILLILAVVLIFSFAQAQVSQQTINYLLNSAQDAWVTQGLAAAGQTNLNLSYLNNFSSSNANEAAKTILAVVAAGQNPYSFNNQNLVDDLLSYYNNQQLGATTLLNDDFWGIMALRAAGMESSAEVIQNSKNYILAGQNSDGGWTYSPTGTSDTNDTAAAIMALLDAGLNINSEVIQNGLTYLENAQNDDGGFSFYPNGESDSGSDSWVMAALYKAGEDPGSWQQGGNSPLSHLQSLALPDGSFKWIAIDPAGNLLMTAYAAVALSESYYPVSYYNPSQTPTNLFHLRIEGSQETYCNDDVEATTALEIVENGAAVCGYTYEIEQTIWGPYLVSINGEIATGSSGWLYRVNWESPQVGAQQYQLEPGDEVLWYFGEFTDLPLKLELSDNQIELEDEVTATVDYYNNGSWLPASNATVFADNNQFTTNDSGQATLTFNLIGSYEVFAEKENYIRSNQQNLIVGSSVSQAVDLSVYINNPSGPPGGNTISFYINSNNLDFGTLELGQAASSSLAITNNGEVPIYLEATVSGDAIFTNNLLLNQVLWEYFNSNISTNQTQDVPVELEVPNNYTGSGQKQGNLIFWGTAQ